MKILKIGSDRKNDIWINDDATVSRFHAELFWNGVDLQKSPIVLITDKDSTNGTFVNGVKIEEPHQLEKLDILKVGTTLIDWMGYLNDERENQKEKFEKKKKSNNSISKKTSPSNKRGNKKPLSIIISSIIIVSMLLLLNKNEEKLGCIDKLAYNFDSTATSMKDSSCIFIKNLKWNDYYQSSKLYFDNKNFENIQYDFILNISDTITDKWLKYELRHNGFYFRELELVEIDTIRYTTSSSYSNKRPSFKTLPKRKKILIQEHLNNVVNDYTLELSSDKYLVNPNKQYKYKIDQSHYIRTDLMNFYTSTPKPFKTIYKTKFLNRIENGYHIDNWFKPNPENITLNPGEFEGYRINIVRY